MNARLSALPTAPAPTITRPASVLPTSPTQPTTAPVSGAPVSVEQEQPAPNSEDRTRRSAPGKRRIHRAPATSTPVDKEVLRFLGRYRIATYAHIAACIDVGEDTIRHRIRRMVNKDLITVHAGAMKRNMVTATSTGLREVGYPWPPYAYSHGGLRHALAATDLGQFFETHGEPVLTEREIRGAWRYGNLTDTLDTRDLDAFPGRHDDDPHHGNYVITPPGAAADSAVIPDLVINRPPTDTGAPAAIAVEIELSAKDATRYRNLFRTYLTHGRSKFAAVMYYTDNRDVAAAVKKAIADTGAGGYIDIQPFTPTSLPAAA